MVPDAGHDLPLPEVYDRKSRRVPAPPFLDQRELARSITTSAPAIASFRPSPVMLLTPVSGEAATTFVAALPQNGNGLRADQAGAADDDDLHGLPLRPALDER